MTGRTGSDDPACPVCATAAAGVLHAHTDSELTMWLAEGEQVLHDGVLQLACLQCLITYKVGDGHCCAIDRGAT